MSAFSEITFWGWVLIMNYTICNSFRFGVKEAAQSLQYELFKERVSIPDAPITWINILTMQHYSVNATSVLAHEEE